MSRRPSVWIVAVGQLIACALFNCAAMILFGALAEPRWP